MPGATYGYVNGQPDEETNLRRCWEVYQSDQHGQKATDLLVKHTAAFGLVISQNGKYGYFRLVQSIGRPPLVLRPIWSNVQRTDDLTS